MRASWRARAARIAPGWRSQSRVLPSMSVKRNVTVPVGWLDIDPAGGGHLPELLFAQRQDVGAIAEDRSRLSKCLIVPVLDGDRHQVDAAPVGLEGVEDEEAGIGRPCRVVL